MISNACTCLYHFAALNVEHWETFQAKTKKQQLRDMTAPDTADAIREVRCGISSVGFALMWMLRARSHILLVEYFHQLPSLHLSSISRTERREPRTWREVQRCKGKQWQARKRWLIVALCKLIATEPSLREVFQRPESQILGLHSLAWPFDACYTAEILWCDTGIV